VAKKSSKSTKKPTQLKSTKNYSWKVIVLMIFAIALAGGFMVYQSMASSRVTFTRYADEMTGGYKNRLFNNKTRSATSPIFAPVTFKESVASRVICVHYGVEVPSPKDGLGFEVELIDSSDETVNISKRFSISGKKKGDTDYACLRTSEASSGNTPAREFRDAGSVRVQMVGRGGILVDKIEGRR
jgi:hypothetical protein